MQASLTLLDSGRVVRPERRQYLRQEMPMTETGIDSTMLRDVYVALGDATGDDRWAVHVYVNPLVRFIWTGGLIILSGLFLSLTGRRRNNKISVTTDEHR
jgi:cytochrome c-type biogenesis protein CcmF